MQHVAKAIHFVPDFLIVLRHAQRNSVVLVIRVQISAGFLDGDHFTNHGVGSAPEFGLNAGLQRPSDTINPLVNVGIRKVGALLWFGTLSYQSAEIVHAAVLFQFLAHGRNAALYVGLAALGPKALFNRDCPNRNAVQLRIRRAGGVDHALILPSQSRRGANVKKPRQRAVTRE